MSHGSSSPSESPLPPARTIAAWRVLLRAAGVLLALFTLCFWAAKGYHRGWTKNRVLVDQLDEVTGIVTPTYVDRFVPGIDYLGGGIFMGTVLFAATLIPARRRKPA